MINAKVLQAYLTLDNLITHELAKEFDQWLHGNRHPIYKQILERVKCGSPWIGWDKDSWRKFTETDVEELDSLGFKIIKDGESKWHINVNDNEA